MNVIVHGDTDHLAVSAADLIAAVIEESPGERVTIGLAGGSTPATTYQRLRDLPLSWERVDAWLSDERWVPHDHNDSNGRMVSQTLTDHVAARLHRPRWAPWLSPTDSAAHYEATLRGLHPQGRADLILLGMGDDGHTASLFPGTEALEAPPGRWFVANNVPQLDTDRLTVTYSFLDQAHRVVFLVAGESKSDTLRRVLEPDEGDEPLPSAAVLDGKAEVTWLVDRAAAAGLVRTPTEAAD